MIYLDYAKSMANGYILNFFADAEEDIASVSNGKHFITKNGTDYGVPLPSSTIVITMPDKTKKTYILNEASEWQLGGGETDYSKLTNVPIILANLADKEFIPEANTYYEHLGETTEDFTKGIIYLYDGKEYKAIDGSGSGGIQSDYNQNDSTAPDYIKNRPFYEESSLTEVVNFKVISGNLKEEGSQVTIEYNGERHTGTVEVNSGNYTLTIEELEKLGFGCTIEIKTDQTILLLYHKKEYEIKADDEVIFNGVKYQVKTLPSTIEDIGGKCYISDGEIDFESFETITASFMYMFEIGATDGGILLDSYAIFNSTTNVDFNIKAGQTTIKTIDPKFIKDMYYSTESLTPLIDFKVISGDINAIGSTMVVQYNGKEYTETVKDAAESGSSKHRPYIGFKFEEGVVITEEHPFSYGVNLLDADDFDSNQLLCAPKAVSENQTVIYNGNENVVKRLTMDVISMLYVGNLYLTSAELPDTGEQYLTLFDYIKIATEGTLDLMFSIVPQDGISSEISDGKINYIDPKYIKDMYYTKPEGSVGKVLVFKGEINGMAENIPNVFEEGDMVSLKEPEVQLDVSVIAKYHKGSDENSSFAYIGNLSLFTVIEGAPDTKEDYLLICGYETSNENTTSVLIYTNKKHDSPNNIEVYKGEDPIVRIPEKYMPENVALKSYVNDAISNAITKTLNTEV